MGLFADLRVQIESFDLEELTVLRHVVDERIRVLREKDLVDPFAPDEDEQRMIRGGDVLGAIRNMRMRTGLPLRSSKDYIDSWIRTRGGR